MIDTTSITLTSFSLVQDTKAVLQKFMDTAGGDINFNLIALANADNPFA